MERIDVELRNLQFTFAAEFDEKAPLRMETLRKALTRYSLVRADLDIAGEISRDDRGLWLTARTNGARFLLTGPAGDADAPPPGLDELLKAGRTKVRLGGELRDEGGQKLRVSAFRALELK